MYPPVGWQNLSATKYKTRDRASILPAVQAVHPEATETQVANGLYTYSLPKRSRKRSPLVAIAWGEEGGPWWAYAIMSNIALKIGVQCSLFAVSATRYRILPNAGEETPTILRQIASAKARNKRLEKSDPAKPRQKRPKKPAARSQPAKSVVSESQHETFLQRDNRGWHVTVEGAGIEQTFGPYPTVDDANRAVPALIRRVEQSISHSG